MLEVTASVPSSVHHCMADMPRASGKRPRATNDSSGNGGLTASLSPAKHSRQAGQESGTSALTSCQYRIDVMSEGFWDGLYRTRCGFRTIGLYEMHSDAFNHACLDFAKRSGRIKPADIHYRDAAEGATPTAT